MEAPAKKFGNSPLFLGVLFLMFMTMCFSLGYPVLNRYDPRTIEGVGCDATEYYKMAEFKYTEADAPFRFRVLIPTLAGLVFPVVSRLCPHSWNPMFLSLLFVNALFLSSTALFLLFLALHLKLGTTASILAPFLFLTGFPIANGHLSGLVDAGEAFFIMALIACVAKRKWLYCPGIILVSSLAKETTVLFGSTFLFVSWLADFAAAKNKDYRPVPFIGLSILAAAISVPLIRALVGGEPYAVHTFNGEQLHYLFPNLAIIFTAGTMLYTFIFLLPAGLRHAFRMPGWFLYGSLAMGVVAVLCGAYAKIGGNLYRPLFDTIGPLFCISAARTVGRIISFFNERRGGENSPED